MSQRMVKAGGSTTAGSPAPGPRSSAIKRHKNITARFFRKVSKRSAKKAPTVALLDGTPGNFAHLNHLHLSPSLFLTLAALTKTLAKPAVGIAVIAGFFASVAASPTYSYQKASLNNELVDAVQLAAIRSGSSPLAQPDDATLALQNKVSFISGLIAVHRPSLRNSGEIAKDIVELSASAEVDPLYIAAIISVESRFGNKERSPVGALGLMQLMPTTAKAVSQAKTGQKSYPLLTDSRTNIKLGIEYIKQLEERYRGNRQLALAAYNWGPTNVARVRGNRAQIPPAVNRYASTVLERYLRWSGHYKNAEHHAADIGVELRASSDLTNQTLNE